MSARTILQNFTVDSLPNLDVVVQGALELLQDSELPDLQLDRYSRPLVIGSGGAIVAGEMIFAGRNAVFANESTYLQILDMLADIDAVIVISASGSKHAIEIAKEVSQRDLPMMLWTSNPQAPAAEALQPEQVVVLPKNREPYTYNTSTYLSMVAAAYSSTLAPVQGYLEREIEPRLLRHMETYGAFTFIVPTELAKITQLIQIKFEEMFLPIVVGRGYTTEDIKHAKTVIQSGDELFIALGVENEHYGLPKNRLSIPLPADCDYPTMIAITYYIIGRIQAAHPPYFKNNIQAYADNAAAIFGQSINPIVE